MVVLRTYRVLYFLRTAMGIHGRPKSIPEDLFGRPKSIPELFKSSAPPLGQPWVPTVVLRTYRTRSVLRTRSVISAVALIQVLAINDRPREALRTAMGTHDRPKEGPEKQGLGALRTAVGIHGRPKDLPEPNFGRANDLTEPPQTQTFVGSCTGNLEKFEGPSFGRVKSIW
jgi:hypothetical protein